MMDDAKAAEVAKAYNAQEGVVVQVNGRGGVVRACPTIDLDDHYYRRVLTQPVERSALSCTSAVLHLLRTKFY